MRLLANLDYSTDERWWVATLRYNDIDWACENCLDQGLKDQAVEIEQRINCQFRKKQNEKNVDTKTGRYLTQVKPA